MNKLEESQVKSLKRKSILTEQENKSTEQEQTITHNGLV